MIFMRQVLLFSKLANIEISVCLIKPFYKIKIFLVLMVFIQI